MNASQFQYADVFTEMSYLHAKSVMPHTLDFFSGLFGQVTKQTGTIIAPNLDEQRRVSNAGVPTPTGERYPSRKLDTKTFVYQTGHYGDQMDYQTIEGYLAEQYTASPVELAHIQAVTERSIVSTLAGWCNEFMTAGNYPTASKVDKNASKWSKTTVDLVDQVADQLLAIHKRTGLRPNMMIVSPDVHEVICQNVQVQDRIAGNGTVYVVPNAQNQSEFQNTQNDNLALYAKVFRVQQYFVLDASYNASAVNATAVNTWLAEGKVLLGYMGKVSSDGENEVKTLGFGASVYLDYTSKIPPSAIIQPATLPGGNPFPLYVRRDYDPLTAGGGTNIVVCDLTAGFKLTTTEYATLLYNLV